MGNDITNLDPSKAAAAVRKKSVIIKTVRNTLVVYTLPTTYIYTCTEIHVYSLSSCWVSPSDGCGTAVATALLYLPTYQ